MANHQPTLEAQTLFYDDRWKDSERSLDYLQVARLAEILNAFSLILRSNKKKDLKICDLGCGTGWLSNEVSKFGHVIGIDLSPEGIEIARKRWPKITFLSGNILEYKPDTKFDIVVSSEVIEHIPDQKKYVEILSATLKPGGHVILTCPNSRAKQACKASGFVTQPIEYWLSRSDLLSMFSIEFDILLHKTFLFDFAYTGIFRLTSAPKLLKLVSTMGLIHLYDGLRNTLSLGLHHIFVARKRGEMDK